MAESYPLYWPEGRPRAHRPERSKFDTSPQVSQLCLMDELRLMGVTDIILSTNVKLRLDGLPYASGRAPDDTGVAVYFSYKKNPVCFACDRWDRVHDNIQAIRKTIGALRGIARWGTGDMIEAAFKGFQALPAPSWRDDLGLSADATLQDAETAYRTLARSSHPDAGGSDEGMVRLNIAIGQARESKTEGT